MPEISIPKLQKTILVPVGANLMDALLEAGLPVASSCGGEGVCGKCKIKVVNGHEQVSPPTEIELYLRESHNISLGFRVSCQTQVLGDVIVEASYW